MRRVVCDTGPILHLHEARALELLRHTGEVLIPPAVEEELARWITGWAEVRPSWIRSFDLADRWVTDWQSWCDAGILQVGESQALALARQVAADWFLTDDTPRD